MLPLFFAGSLDSEWRSLVVQMSEIAEYIRASKDVLDILKTLGGLIPRGPDSDAARQRLDEAEKALKASEAQLAKALGYQLCQCAFPPNIMLSVGRHPVHDKEIFECPACKKQEPSEHRFRQLDQFVAHNEGRPRSWVDARLGRQRD